MLNYSYSGVTFDTIPDHIAMSYHISGCGIDCKGCHSPETHDINFGTELTLDIVIRDAVNPAYSCILFFGGDHSPKELQTYFQAIRETVPHKPIALFTGLNYEEVPPSLIPYLSFIKVGRFIKTLGGLQCPETTNQKLIDLRSVNGFE